MAFQERVLFAVFLLVALLVLLLVLALVLILVLILVTLVLVILTVVLHEEHLLSPCCVQVYCCRRSFQIYKEKDKKYVDK